jgi:hypothetical protein
MITRTDFWNTVESLPPQRFHFLLVHLLGRKPDVSGIQPNFEMTWGEVLQLRLAERLTQLGVPKDAQFSMLTAWGETLGAAGEIWAEEKQDGVEYDHVFFAVSNFRYASMPYSQNRRFYDAAEENWIDELDRPAEIIISIDLYEMMYGFLGRLNARRAEHGEDPIAIGAAEAVSDAAPNQPAADSSAGPA